MDSSPAMTIPSSPDPRWPDRSRPVEVSVLCCGGCGGEVAVRDADPAHCAYCALAVPIPAAHRELRRLQRDAEHTRIEAQTLLARLDGPTPLWGKLAARVFDIPGLVFWPSYGAVLSIAGWRLARRVIAAVAVATRRHDDGNVLLADGAGTATWILTFVVGALAVRALGIYANRHNEGRTELLAGMAAQAPRLPGGPSRCRRCAGPLAIAAGESVVACMYCRADNAVALRPEFLGALRGSVQGVHQSVANAHEAFVEETAERRRQITREFRTKALWGLGYGALAGTILLSLDAGIAHNGTGGWPPVTGAFGVLGFIALLFVGYQRLSVDGAEDDVEERSASNDVPRWIGWIGPVLVWAYLPFWWMSTR